MSCVRDRGRCAALMCLLILTAGAGRSLSPMRQLLVLQSFNRGNIILDRFTGELRADRRGEGREA